MKLEIEIFDPCKEAIDFRRNFKTFKDAWENCPRGDWMLWIAKRLDIDLKTLTKAKALCAMTVKHLMEDERSIHACNVALKFSEGNATRENLDAAHADAYAAASLAAAAYAATAASYAAADADAASLAAADAAAAASYAAASYADAAAASYAAASAAAAASYAAADAQKKSRKQTSDICREILTSEVFKKLDQINNKT